MGLVRGVGLFLGGILVLAGVFTISNVIRLTVYARQDELDMWNAVAILGDSFGLAFAIPGALVRGTELEARLRITSYNVCYTKLLRSGTGHSIVTIASWRRGSGAVRCAPPHATTAAAIRTTATMAIPGLMEPP